MLGARPAALLRIIVIGAAVLGLAHIALGELQPPTPGTATMSSAGALVRTAFALGAAVAGILGPGLAWRRRRGRPVDIATLWIPGVLVLAASGLATWLLASRVDTYSTGTALLGLTLAAVLVAMLLPAAREAEAPSATDTFVVVLALVLTVLCVGRAAWSSLPQGELYGGLYYRSLEVGDRSDPRISYHVAQLAMLGERQDGELSKRFFAPYEFGDRGPIAGLATAPIIIAGGITAPRGLPSDVWTPFDTDGYASYRITMEAMAALSVVLAAAGFVGRRATPLAARLSAVVVATTPFIAHETWFTWPKLLTAAFALVGLDLVLRRRAVLGAAALVAACLTHPVGVLVGPCVLLIWVVQALRARTPVRAIFSVGGVVVGGLLLWYVAWPVVVGGVDRSKFSDYLHQADGVSPATLHAYVESRVRSLANTFVPLRLWIVEGTDKRVNEYGRLTPSPWPVRIDFAYWDTLPFAVGITYYLPFLLALVRSARRNLVPIMVALVLPVLGFAVYWGSTSTGLMREGLHFWLLLALVMAAWEHARDGGTKRAGRLRVFMVLRVGEVLVLTLVPSLLTTGWSAGTQFHATDVVALAVIIASAGALAWMAWTACSDLFAASGPQAGDDVLAVAQDMQRN